MITREQRTFLQVFAAVTMLLDHIGALFFPQQIWLRAIGRLSFPLFAFGIAEGVAHTRSFWRYFGRILLTAAVSQPVYWLAFQDRRANPLFMLAWGAAAVYFWRKETPEGRLAAGLLLFSAAWARMSYGWYGVWTIFLFSFYHGYRAFCFYAQAAASALYCIAAGAWLQMLSLFAFALTGSGQKLRLRLPRYALYAFYPLHLLLLWGIMRLIAAAPGK